PQAGDLVGRLYAGLGLARRPGASNGLQRAALRILESDTGSLVRLRGSLTMATDKCIQCDVAIVGSGIAGALIALRLGAAGKQCVILEAGDGLPPDVNGYMKRFFTALAKVPEIPYTPDLFTPPGSTTLTNPTTLNVGRPTVLTLDATTWQD